MDGVCCDFCKATFELFDRKEFIDNWPIGKVKVEEVLEISRGYFWSKLDRAGGDFWKNIEEFPWFKELHRELKQRGTVIFCTSPSQDPECVKGKLQWLQNRFGRHFRDYVFMDKKYLLAKPNTLLIDDMDYQIENFSTHGGRGILFPQNWNRYSGIDNKVKHVIEQMEKKHES